MVPLILEVFAFVLFVLAGLWGYWRVNPAPISLGWIGLACWVLAELLGKGGPYLGVH